MIPGRTPRKIARRKLANRLVGILHGCLAAAARYDEARAWHPTVERLAA